MKRYIVIGRVEHLGRTLLVLSSRAGSAVDYHVALVSDNSLRDFFIVFDLLLA